MTQVWSLLSLSCDRVITIPPIDLARQYTHIHAEIERAVQAVMTSGRYIGGEVVNQFEQEFAAYVGTAHCVSCNSGTDALYLALRSLKIGAGDEVIVPPFTFIATAETVSAVGATPVFVDIDRDTFNLDLSQVAAAITDRTRAIIPVHLFGNPVNLEQLQAIAQHPSHPQPIKIIEDCAQATGAQWGERRVGSIGDLGCFSFFPTKNLGAFGDGGAVTTNDPELADRMRILKEHGSPQRYFHTDIGINSRLDAIQAAILRVKLGWLDHWNQQRRQIAAYYTEQLGAIEHLKLPQATPGGTSVWNQYTLRFACNNAQMRDQLRTHLQEHGVATMVYYPFPLHQQPVYSPAHPTTQAEQDFPAAEQVAREVLSIPMFPELTTAEQDRVVYALQASLSSLISATPAS